MPDSPFGRGSGGLPGRYAGRPAPRPWERSFRCPSAARRRTAEAPVQRYEDFVALHDEIAVRSGPPLRRLWWTGAAAAFAGSVLAFHADATETLLGVETTSGPTWVTTQEHPESLPFDIRVGGEVMRVVAIIGDGQALPQSFEVVRSVNGVVKEHLSGAAVRLAHPAVVAL